MTSTTGLDPIEAIKAAPLTFSLYREVHKGLRYALFQLTIEAGAADVTDTGARDELVTHVHGVLELLNDHHDHERDHMEPLIAERAPSLAALVEEGHTETEADMVEIELRTDKLAGAAGRDAVAAGWDLYGCLTMFTARYLAHMGLEEGAVMETLRESTSLEDLFVVQVVLRGSIAPPKMCEFLKVVMPAINVDERTEMLGGMHAGAPPEVFELFRSTAEASLSRAQYEEVADRLGLT
jgi:hypothetical protein